MAIQLQNTRGFSANGVKMLVYGPAGAGKTTLISTLPNAVVLSAESGLLALSEHDIPYIEIKGMADLGEAYTWIIESDEAKQFDTVCLDSLSEIAEVCLSAEKAQAKDPRAAYGEMQDKMGSFVRSFRDLPGKNVYFSAQLEKSTDETGRVLYAPAMPGKKTGQSLPYFFDEVFALRVEKDNEGNKQRMLQCDGDGLWEAKDRSGKLGDWEEADLGAVIRKIVGGK